jgi:anti-sigma factor RsiW
MTTCDEVRERLTEHVLGTLDDVEDLAVRKHLRGCAGCRQELVALGDGMALFSLAAHDRTPPPELEDRVRTVLEQEWSEARPPVRDRPIRAWLAAAAAILVVVASLSWALVQHHQASVATADASSYEQLLNSLGGKEFRLGPLQAARGTTVEGTVVAYDSSHNQSWVAVFVRAPGSAGVATATLSASDGRSIPLPPLKIADDGAGSTWLVTAANLEQFDRITITAPDGSVLATAQLEAA